MCSPSSLILIPSISIFPAENSINLNKVYKIVLFPGPVLPTIPIFILASAKKLKFLSAGSKFPLELIVKLLNLILPY